MDLASTEPLGFECSFCDYVCANNRIGKGLMIVHLGQEHEDKFREAFGDEADRVFAETCAKLKATYEAAFN